MYLYDGLEEIVPISVFIKVMSDFIISKLT